MSIGNRSSCSYFSMAMLLALPVQAQTADKNAPEMSSHDTPATFKAKVNLVLVPVVVRDAEGHAIGNLRQEDFQLFDKGKPQLISRFSVEKSAGQTLAEKRSPEVNTTEQSAGAA